MSHAVTLNNWQQARAILQSAAEWIRRRVEDGRPVVLTVSDGKRTLPQNALLHALLSDISRTHEWAGAKRDIDVWKRLMVSAWCRARGERIEMLPAIDGHGFDIVFRHTSKLSKADVADLIDYIEAWRAQQ